MVARYLNGGRRLERRMKGIGDICEADGDTALVFLRQEYGYFALPGGAMRFDLLSVLMISLGNKARAFNL